MRFAFLIPAITAIGITGCQVPPAVTGAPSTTPATKPAPTPAAPVATSTVTPIVTPAVTPAPPAPITPAPVSPAPVSPAPVSPAPVSPAAPETNDTSSDVGQAADSTDVPDTDINAIVQDMDETLAADGVSSRTPEPPADDSPEAISPQIVIQSATDPSPAEPIDPDAGVKDSTAPATTELALAAPPTPPPPTPPPELAPQDLVGLDMSVLRQRLGDADFTRREGAVETWQYRFRTCVVDYFLYAGTAGPEVRSWAWRSPVIGGGLDATACRQELAGRDRSS